MKMVKCDITYTSSPTSFKCFVLYFLSMISYCRPKISKNIDSDNFSEVLHISYETDKLLN